MANLWIRSQDKEILIKVDYVEYSELTYGGRIIYKDYRLGEYRGLFGAKKRCFEIIDEIQSLLVINDKVVYEMPEE